MQVIIACLDTRALFEIYSPETKEKPLQIIPEIGIIPPGNEMSQSRKKKMPCGVVNKIFVVVTITRFSSLFLGGNADNFYEMISMHTSAVLFIFIEL